MYKVILFYKFFNVENPEAFRDEQKEICAAFNLKGRMLIAKEGVNATFEGRDMSIEAYKHELLQNPHFAGMVFKESQGNGKNFSKLKVKTRKEIVTLGAGEFNVQEQTAPEISVDELRKLYETNEDFEVLDLRNTYEIEAGRFEKTIHPDLENFRDLPKNISKIEHLKNKKLVAVCTGGIRCEKATCLLKEQGFTNVYQLKDGIHTYMQRYPGQEFKGSLFVFDNRMVTEVVETEGREIVGRCHFCQAECEKFYNDDSVRPSKKIICCDNCITERVASLRKCN